MSEQPPITTRIELSPFDTLRAFADAWPRTGDAAPMFLLGLAEQRSDVGETLGDVALAAAAFGEAIDRLIECIARAAARRDADAITAYVAVLGPVALGIGLRVPIPVPTAPMSDRQWGALLRAIVIEADRIAKARLDERERGALA